MAIHQFDDLEIDEKAARHAKKSIYKLLGQTFLIILLISAALGLTGGKLLARNELISADGKIKVSYARIGRIEIPAELNITLKPSPGEKQVTLWFDEAYMRHMFIKQILPQPIKTELLNHKILYHFAVIPSHGPITISFMLEPQVRGLITAKFGIVNHLNFVLQQFTYP